MSVMDLRTQQAAYSIKLPMFEGPFDLLFHLIRKTEVDIWSVSITEITEQYLVYLKSMQELNLDLASDFLVMAATLLRLKSKLLLPRPPHVAGQGQDAEEELFAINTPEELFQRLEEYRQFKAVALFLREREEEQQKIFLRSTGGRKVMVVTRQESVYTIWEGARNLSEIMLGFAKATFANAYTPPFDEVDDFEITTKANFIATLLELNSRPMPLSSFLAVEGVWEIIITFIALLELARQHRVILLQERPFSAILVSLPAKDAVSKEDKNGNRSAEKDS